MKRSLIIFLLLSLLSQNICVAQFKKQLDSLSVLCNKLTSDSEKVVALGKLADLYYTYQLYHEGDSILNQQLQIADMSDNDNLILSALFGPAITNIGPLSTTESFENSISFLQRGIDYAKSRNLTNYLALGYIRMANILLKRKQNDKALSNALQALQIMPYVSSDSIKTLIYIELGNSYLGKGEAVSAVRNYNNAYDIAAKLKSIPLQSNIYHSFSEMYFLYLNDKETAKEFIKTSLKLNKEHNYIEGQILDYYDLARITDERTYLQKSIALSESFHNYKYILQAKILLLEFYFVVDKNIPKALRYMESEHEVKASYINPGIENYYQAIGHIYYYGNRFDSALYYYKLAEDGFIKKFDENRTGVFFNYIASTYKALHDLPNAIAYFSRALSLSQKTNNTIHIAALSDSLSYMYGQQGDYKQAYTYQEQAKKYNDILTELSRAKDIVLLNVDREKRKHEDELREAAQNQKNKTNVQYMFITVSICVIFILMLVIGMFPVSKLTIKMLGYFFFISLFEFIVLLIDNILLVKAVHGEPLKIWLVKIVLIALLVPLQHYMEHSLIEFLESRKLLEVRTKFSFKKWRVKIKKPAPVIDADIEEDTAVL